MDKFYSIRRNRCKLAQADLSKGIFAKEIKYNCIRNGIKDDDLIKDISEEQCENCPHFKSKFIEYPITVSSIDVKIDDTSLRKNDIGKLVRIRPCGDEYENKTYIGFFLGDLPQSPLISHDPRDNVLHIRPLMNPAIFVPDLKKVVYGCESWWSIIEDEKDLEREITDEVINGQWYVKALKGGFND